ncbi:hypothetical protein BAE44_0008010, partial [Dichanthelium oligosanthes]
VNLALEMKDQGVIGIDLSGNPVVGEWETYLPALQHAKELGIPITIHCGEVEICLTSNVMTGGAPSLELHHFVDLYNAKHPLSLCTDDSGLFSTSLSNEYYLVASTFGLSKPELFHLAQEAVQFIFADDNVKKSLKEVFKHADKRLAVLSKSGAPN